MKIEFYQCGYSVWSKCKEYRFKRWWLVIHKWMICFNFNRVEIGDYVHFPRFISVFEEDL